jgi:4-diphosphocytidyl-2-C-methyl-D-erythritol kinase
MIKYPGCKINLGLNITHKLNNGYHAIESVFVPVTFSDILEVITIPDSENTSFYYSGIPIPGSSLNNIVKKAYELLANKYLLPPIKVQLHKIVPMGAGLGGGSADASAMLILLNDLFNLNISKTELFNMAGSLGADCPFFIENKPAFVTGTGNKIEGINPGLSGKKILLIYPNIHIDTAKAFTHIKPQKPDESIASVVQNIPISEWKNKLKNDFESYVFKTHPEIGKIKNTLYKMGASYASLSGSGSTVYGIFKDEIPPVPRELTKYFIYSGQL